MIFVENPSCRKYKHKLISQRISNIRIHIIYVLLKLSFCLYQYIVLSTYINTPLKFEYLYTTLNWKERVKYCMEYWWSERKIRKRTGNTLITGNDFRSGINSDFLCEKPLCSIIVEMKGNDWLVLLHGYLDNERTERKKTLSGMKGSEIN